MIFEKPLHTQHEKMNGHAPSWCYFVEGILGCFLTHNNNEDDEKYASEKDAFLELITKIRAG